MPDKVMEKDPTHKTRGDERLKKPKKYNVLLINDDFTPMEYVVGVLVRIFRTGVDDAQRITYDVHNNGVGVAGTYTREIAETRVGQVLDDARREGHPLQATMEPAE